MVRSLRRDTTTPAGKPVGCLRDCGHAVQGVVASRQERGPSRRAERTGVQLRVGQAVLRQLVERRHVDPAAVGRPRRQAGIIVEDEQDVRCALGCFLRRERPPVGFGIADIELDGALEVLVGPHGLGSRARLLCAGAGCGESQRPASAAARTSASPTATARCLSVVICGLPCLFGTSQFHSAQIPSERQ